ncbi:MAG: PepSY domain-containing protein [Bdellovibrionales bacterium]
MKLLLAIAMILSIGASAQAKKHCTDEPKDKWMSEADFKKKIEDEGFKIKKFKQPGTCYEIYGTNKEGKKVEIYYNPVDGSVAKEK